MHFDDEQLARDLGSSLISAETTRWGDSHATRRIRLVDGRDLAARWLRGPDAEGQGHALVDRSARLALAGIDVPSPVELIPGATGAWIVSPWIDGRVGAELLDDRATGTALATSMGRLAARVASVSPGDPSIDRTWESAIGVVEAAMTGAAAVRAQLSAEAAAAIEAAISDLERGWPGDVLWSVGLAHGDFAPVNVIATWDERVVLLDLDGLRLAPRIVDVAWWGWVVRYHHPARWSDTWTQFVGAAGLRPGEVLDRAALAVARLLLLERAGKARSPDLEALWTRRLNETSGW